MTTLPVIYYPPGTSRPVHGEATVAPGVELQLKAGDIDVRHALADLRIEPRVGNVPRRITLPDGAALEIADNDALDVALSGVRRGGAGRWLHRLESRLTTVAGALVLTVVVVWMLVRFGLPAAAGWVARAVPPEMDARLGQTGLELLDRTLLSPSTLAPDQQVSLSRMFERIAGDGGDGHRFRLEFRSGADGIGANALALPSGIVVLTDELVELAANDDEVRAVMAHEVGHVIHRHTLRSILQHSSVVILVAAVTGDINFASSVAGGLPTLLLEAGYSREFEREADAYARDWLSRNGVEGDPLGALLERLSEHSGYGDGGFLASHPPTDERIQALDDPE